MKGNKKIRRLAYLSGPVNAVEVYEKWLAQQPPDYFGTSYLWQFYQVCSELDVEAYIITTLPGTYSSKQAGQFRIENRPAPTGLRGISFHIANAFWMLRLLPSLLTFRPSVLVVTAFQNYWFLLSFVKLSKTHIVASLHNTLWPKFAPMRRSWWILLRLNAFFIAHYVDGILVASEDVKEQIRELIGSTAQPIVTFLPTYTPNQFAKIFPADFSARIFRILFAGRIEINKGIYDLLEVAKKLENYPVRPIHFDICGEGPELDKLRLRIASSGLTTTVTCHGFCGREKFSQLLNKAHVVVVPTTINFEEGFAMICAEAILAERPVVTSAVCPALYYIKNAAVEVMPGDVEGYLEQIINLSRDGIYFEKKRLACKELQNQFYDVENSWGAKLRSVIEAVPTVSAT